jgi:hypothetical protein
VLNEIEWLIPVTFKSDIPKNEVHELGDSEHNLSVYCVRYIHITSENTQMHLRKKIGRNWWTLQVAAETEKSSNPAGYKMKV